MLWQLGGKKNFLNSVMISMLASSAAKHGFDYWSSQSKEYEIGICCLSAKQTALKNKCRLISIYIMIKRSSMMSWTTTLEQTKA